MNPFGRVAISDFGVVRSSVLTETEKGSLWSVAFCDCRLVVPKRRVPYLGNRTVTKIDSDNVTGLKNSTSVT